MKKTINLNDDSNFDDSQSKERLVEELSALSEDQINEITRTMRETIADKKPRNVTELHTYFKVILGYDVAYTATAEGFSSPMEVLASSFFRWAPQVVWTGPRGGGKTLAGSMLHVANSEFIPGCVTAHVGATRRQAKFCSQYMINHSRIPEIARHLATTPSNYRAEWSSGSVFEIFSGTIKGVCLSGDTGVVTKSGIVPIRDIVLNNRETYVLSYNFDNRVFEWKPVVGWYSNGMASDWLRIYTDSSDATDAPLMTPNHEIFRLDGSKIAAGNLKVGDRIAIADYGGELSEATITDIERVVLEENRYDISVPGNNNFFLSCGYLVSNSGAHPHVACGDEVEFWDWSTLIQFLGCAKPKGGILESNILFSTRQRSTGTMHKLMKQGHRMGFVTFTSSIFEVMRPCPSCLCKKGDYIDKSACDLWEDCKGERALKATGHISREEVIRIKRRNDVDEEAWITQYLCERPATYGQVYDKLDMDTEWPHGNCLTMPFNPDLPVLLVVDPAGGANYVIGAFQYYPEWDLLHLFDELFYPGGSTTTQAKKDLQLKSWHPYIEKVVVDARRRSDIMEWKSSADGLGAYPAIPSVVQHGETRVALVSGGIKRLKSRILSAMGRRRFTINVPECPNIARQLENYRWRVDKENRILTDTPADTDSDGPDVCRYANDYLEFSMRRGKSTKFQGI